MNQQFAKVFGFLALTFLVGCAAQGNDNILWSAAESQDMAQADSTSESIAVSRSSMRRASYQEEAKVSERSSGPSYTTSQVSAAAGAAFGAGLGAVVGSATGNAAEGLAIGAVAGAASGALVGNEFQKRDEIVDQQRELLARQDERIQTQERQIQEIRRSLEDRFPTNKPSASPKISLDKYRGSPAAKPFAGSGVAPRARMNSAAATSYASASKTSVTASKNYGGKLASAAPVTKKEIPVVNTIAKQNKLEPAKAVKTAMPVQNSQIASAAKASVIPPAAIPIAKSEAPKQEIARAIPPVAELKQVPAAPAPIAEVKQPAATSPVAKTTPVSTVAKMSTAETTGCKEAVDESRRGEEAISEADKLFYYRRAARLCPVESGYRVKIGQVYATLGKRDQAKGEFEKALEIDPENVVANEELSLLESNI